MTSVALALACGQAADPPAATAPAEPASARVPAAEPPCGFDNDVRLQLMASGRLLLAEQPRLHVSKSLEPQQARALESALIALAPEFCRERKVVPAQPLGAGPAPILTVQSYERDDSRASPSATLALHEQPPQCRPGACDPSVRLYVERDGVTWSYAAGRDAFEFVRRPLSELSARAPTFNEPRLALSFTDLSARGASPAAQLQQQLNGHAPAIEACEMFLPLRRSVTWHVRTKFRVDPKGAVQVQESTCNECSGALTHCVSSATSRWSFPALAGAEVSYTARFQR